MVDQPTQRPLDAPDWIDQVLQAIEQMDPKGEGSGSQDSENEQILFRLRELQRSVDEVKSELQAIRSEGIPGIWG